MPTWWIDGNLGMDRAGFLYATWDTQTARGDIGWISYSTDHGGTWSAPLRVTSDHDNAMHNLEVAGAGPGVADVALCRSRIGFRCGLYFPEVRRLAGTR